jgi:hypothetical protein
MRFSASSICLARRSCSALKRAGAVGLALLACQPAGLLAGVGQALLVGRDQGAGLLVGFFGRVEIALDLGLALGQRVGDRRYREPRHHEVEDHESDREPDQLRREVVDVELRHARRGGSADRGEAGETASQCAVDRFPHDRWFQAPVTEQEA